MYDFDTRFGGLRRLYGSDEVDYLRQRHVCVIGIGGVGSWCVEALARSGIGELTLIDMDDICATNTNRQVHTLSETIGQDKSEVMAERAKSINPEIKINIVDDFISTENVAEYLHNEMHYVIDAIDAVKAKAGVIGYCKRNKIPVITIGGAGGQLDPSLIQIADLSKTYQDPLLAKVKSTLKRDYNFSKNPKRKFQVDAVFSSEQLVYPKPDGSVCQQKSFSDGSTRLDCASGFGAATVVTASFGLFAVSKVINKLIEKFRREQN